MRNIILSIAIFLFFSCKNSENKVELTSFRIKEINNIIKTIIIEDSLEVFGKEKGKKMLCKDLIKLDIYVPEKPKNDEIQIPPPPSFNNVSITDLIQYDRKSTLFNSTDSINLLKQNLNPKKLEVDSDIFDKVNFTTKHEEIYKKETGESYDFYEITIPIFSLNGQLAYLEVNYYCGRLCGGGKSIYLKKINGKWKVIEKRTTWIS